MCCLVWPLSAAKLRLHGGSPSSCYGVRAHKPLLFRNGLNGLTLMHTPSLLMPQERLHRCFFIDAPGIFSFLFNALWPFIDPVGVQADEHVLVNAISAPDSWLGLWALRLLACAPTCMLGLYAFHARCAGHAAEDCVHQHQGLQQAGRASAPEASRAAATEVSTMTRRPKWTSPNPLLLRPCPAVCVSVRIVQIDAVNAAGSDGAAREAALQEAAKPAEPDAFDKCVRGSELDNWKQGVETGF